VADGCVVSENEPGRTRLRAGIGGVHLSKISRTKENAGFFDAGWGALNGC
jgi:hypothetical protein